MSHPIPTLDYTEETTEGYSDSFISKEDEATDTEWDSIKAHEKAMEDYFTKEPYNFGGQHYI